MTRRYAVQLCGLAAVVLSGCGGDVQRGKLHGTIKSQGKPVSFGTLIFLGSDNMTYPADLGKDGSYTVERVPFGPIAVALQQSALRPAPKADPGTVRAKGGMSETKDAAREVAPPEPKATWVVVPPLYADAAKSGLAFDLKAAVQEWSVDLK